MNREDEKKTSSPAEDKAQRAADLNAPGLRKEDDEEHSYPGKLDQVEGSMDNGEVGGGLGRDNT